MAVERAGFVYNNAGTAIQGATVDAFDRNTTTPNRGTTTTDANGYWTLSIATEGRYDVRVTSGSSIRFLKYDASEQMQELEVNVLKIRDSNDTHTYEFVPSDLAANRTITIPLLAGNDTLPLIGFAQTWSAIQTHSARIDMSASAIRWTSGVAVTAAQYEITRDADGTNQLHFNVPTGATFEWSTNDVSQMVFNAGLLLINATSAANATIAVVIQQGANDNNIFELKSSDVAHGITDIAETDTYAQVRKATAAEGGFFLRGFTTGVTGATSAVFLAGSHGATPDTTDTTSSVGVVRLSGNKKSGTTIAALAATENILTIDDGSLVRFLIKGNGALHATNVTGGQLDGTALDAFDDIGLVRVWQRDRVSDLGIAMSKWDEAIQASKAELIQLGVLSSKGDFYNLQRMNDLLGGAIWQLHCHDQELAERVAIMEERLLALGAG